MLYTNTVEVTPTVVTARFGDVDDEICCCCWRGTVWTAVAVTVRVDLARPAEDEDGLAFEGATTIVCTPASADEEDDGDDNEDDDDEDDEKGVGKAIHIASPADELVIRFDKVAVFIDDEDDVVEDAGVDEVRADDDVIEVVAEDRSVHHGRLDVGGEAVGTAGASTSTSSS